MINRERIGQFMVKFAMIAIFVMCGCLFITVNGVLLYLALVSDTMTNMISFLGLLVIANIFFTFLVGGELMRSGKEKRFNRC